MRCGAGGEGQSATQSVSVPVPAVRRAVPREASPGVAKETAAQGQTMPGRDVRPGLYEGREGPHLPRWQPGPAHLRFTRPPPHTHRAVSLRCKPIRMAGALCQGPSVVWPHSCVGCPPPHAAGGLIGLRLTCAVAPLRPPFPPHKQPQPSARLPGTLSSSHTRAKRTAPETRAAFPFAGFCGLAWFAVTS